MFERFSDRRRRAIAFARQEARRLNNEFIGPEHFFLGILQEGGGVAVNHHRVDLRSDARRTLLLASRQTGV